LEFTAPAGDGGDGGDGGDEVMREVMEVLEVMGRGLMRTAFTPGSRNLYPQPFLLPARTSGKRKGLFGHRLLRRPK
jgi:hypothetical protein